jgi:hypothetical protein
MAVAVQKHRFTADDYQRMGEARILTEEDRVELIDGEVVAMTPIGPAHNVAVNRANKAMVTAAGNAAIVQTQGSIRLDEFHEPQPDLVLLRPPFERYASHLPGPSDVLLIVEVAESSLEYDRDVKLRMYAESGIREYWIVDLTATRVLCCSGPRAGAYVNRREHQRGESIAPEALPHCVISTGDLLTV